MTRRRADNSYVNIARNLISAEAGTGLRIMVSLMGGLQFAAVGIAVPWLYAVTRRQYLRDEHVLVGLLAAAMAWFGLLTWIWRRSGTARSLHRPLLLTAALITISILGSIVIDAAVRNEEPAIAAWLLLMCSVLILIWLPAVAARRRAGGVFNADDTVDVTCPACGYSLIGLRDLRCPECGETFTIDELIAAQGYGEPPPHEPRVIRSPGRAPPETG